MRRAEASNDSRATVTIGIGPVFGAVDDTPQNLKAEVLDNGYSVPGLARRWDHRRDHSYNHETEKVSLGKISTSLQKLR
jgi:hypothetical protein